MSSYILRHTDLDLWRQAKAKATLEGVSMKALIERLLADYLKAPQVNLKSGANGRS